MAELFLATERGAHDFERLVVVKRMLPHLASDASFIQMFLDEARICARISHPNVVQIIELGEHQGAPFIAMEYVHGTTLKDLVTVTDQKRYHLPLGVAVHLLAQAAAGAHAVHELCEPDGRPCGLIHRDISPHNLMVTPDGHVKLLDFGIAKKAGSERTRTGVLKGKLSYMSPEQCQQAEMDRRSDIYALGIVLWELLAGEKLFAERSELQVMQAIVNGDLRDLAKVRPDVPVGIQQVVRQALAARVGDRFATADALRRALLSAAERENIRVDPDVAREFIRDMLGDRLREQQDLIDLARERTNSSSPFDSFTGSGAPTTTASAQATQVTRYGVAGLMGGVLVTLGALALLSSLVVLGAVLAYTSGMMDDPDPYARFAVPTGKPIKLRFAPTIDGALLMGEMEPFRRYLQDRVGRPVEFSVGADYAATADAMVAGDVDYASLPPAMTIRTLLAHPEVELLAGKQLGGSSGTDGVLLVRDDAPVSSIADLKGLTFCFPDVDSTTGYVLPRVYLRAQGLDPDVDLVVAPARGNHLGVIRGLVSGECDVGGVYRGALDEADDMGIEGSRTRILAMTGRTPHEAIAASPKTTTAERAQMQAALLAFDPMLDLGVATVGDTEKLSGWIPIDQDAYDRLKSAVAEEERVKAKHAP